MSWYSKLRSLFGGDDCCWWTKQGGVIDGPFESQADAKIYAREQNRRMDRHGYVTGPVLVRKGRRDRHPWRKR